MSKILTIIVAFAAAIVCYLIGGAKGVFGLLVLGGLFELLGWVRLFQREDKSSKVKG